MTPQTAADLIEASIPLGLGIWAALVAYRKIRSPRFDALLTRHGGLFRIVGPALIAFGILRVVMSLLPTTPPPADGWHEVRRPRS